MAVKSRKKLVAVPFGEDRFEGDSAFYCTSSAVPYEDGMTITDVRAAYKARLLKDGDTDEEGATNDASEIAGAWVLDTKAVRAIDYLWSDMDPGNDSSTYRTNRAAKHMAAKMAVKTLVERNFKKRRAAEAAAKQKYLDDNYKAFTFNYNGVGGGNWDRLARKYGHANLVMPDHSYDEEHHKETIYVKKTALKKG